MPGWLALPRSWLDSLGEIARFGGTVMGQVYVGRVLRFFGESLRQAGILILTSRAPTCCAPRARPPMRASSRPGVTCARSSPMPSAT